MEKQCQYCAKSIPVEVEACIYCGKIQRAESKTGVTSVKCKKCAMDIHKAAIICPYCKKRQKMSLLVKFFLGGIVFFVFLSVLRGPSTQRKMPVEHTETVTNQKAARPEIEKNAEPKRVEYPETVYARLTAKELYSEYKANEIKADDMYKNKLLEVSGIVNRIAKDILDSPYVTLKTDDSLFSVQCMLADSEKSRAAGLAIGETIVVEGKNSGKMANVILRNCKIK